MGSPGFCIPSFEGILQAGYAVPAVVTVPDRQKGRGLKVQGSEVKKFALEKGIEVLQPVNFSEEQFINRLNELKPDIFVIIAFRILPREIFTIPTSGSVNLHGSLLPKYRGAAPVPRAIINGEKETGLTTFFLDDKVDTGNIILQKKIEIGPDETYGELYDRMANEGTALVLQTIELIINGTYNLIPQENSLATKAPKIFRKDCEIIWADESQKLHNLIRGLSPHPGAFTHLNNKIIKIIRTKLTDMKTELKPGTIMISNGRLFAAAGDNMIEITEIQPEGKKPMKAKDFLNGLKPDTGFIFE
ncbi:MAG: methionyl-tRNA formyltransferase [Ignavibacteria bacterium]|jgi:methionyl-tRNA formyltransferase|nr:methionyl-tRNA formyltransferase [Ignavibacteria bacterium]